MPFQVYTQSEVDVVLCDIILEIGALKSADSITSINMFVSAFSFSSPTESSSPPTESLSSSEISTMSS